MIIKNIVNLEEVGDDVAMDDIDNLWLVKGVDMVMIW